MKLIKSLIILIFSIIGFSNTTTSCGGDSSMCGNAPFRLCKSNSSLIEGFGNKIDIDKINQRVVFTIKYEDEFENRIVSIGINDFNRGNILKSHGTLYGQSTYQVIRGLFQFLPISQRMIVNREVRIAGSTSNIFFPNNTFGNELTWNQPGNFIFDEENDIQYTCWPYTSKIYKGKIGLYNDLGETIYNGPCNEMKNVYNKLYIFDGSMAIYQGKLNNNITMNIRDLPLVYNETVANKIKEFDVSPTHLYISDQVDKKIYQVSFSDPHKKKKTILSLGEVPTSIQYFENYIYYSLNGTISRVSINNANSSETLFDSTSTNNGNCICGQGFTGDHCNECNSTNNIISWVNGIPRCIPINVDGNPITCDYDYQCKTSHCQTIPISGGNKGC